MKPTLSPLNLPVRTMAILAAAILTIGAIGNAQTFAILKSFNGLESGFSTSGPTLTNGILYGIGGGVWKISTNGTDFGVIHQFTGGSEGEYPVGRATVSGGTLYGVTYRGGTNDAGEDGGVIYRVNTDGSGFSVLRRLNRALGDGTKPASGMVLSGGILYGTTLGGG